MERFSSWSAEILDCLCHMCLPDLATGRDKPWWQHTVWSQDKDLEGSCKMATYFLRLSLFFLQAIFGCGVSCLSKLCASRWTQESCIWSHECMACWQNTRVDLQLKMCSLTDYESLCAGLSAANHLQKLGFKVVVLEGHSRPGGRVHSVKLQVTFLPDAWHQKWTSQYDFWSFRFTPPVCPVRICNSHPSGCPDLSSVENTVLRTTPLIRFD